MGYSIEIPTIRSTVHYGNQITAKNIFANVKIQGKNHSYNLKKQGKKLNK